MHCNYQRMKRAFDGDKALELAGLKVEKVEDLPFQRKVDGNTLPLILHCKDDAAKPDQVAQWISKNQAALEGLLAKHGVVLFRGFPLDSAATFNTFVEGFQGWKDLSYEDSLSFAVRTHHLGRVCTTNDGKNGGLVFHHEQAQTPRWPSKVFFFALKAAKKGGETAVCPSDELLREIESKHPEFAKDCEEKGVRYTCLLSADPNPELGVGRGWKSFFGRDSKEECEKRMKHYGYSWKWLGEDKMTLQATSPRLDAVKVAPGSGKRVFFNQIVAMMANAQEWLKVANDKQEGTPKANEEEEKTDIGSRLNQFLTFGDGAAMDPKVLAWIKDRADALGVDLPWEDGDVALLDNYLVMHARRLWDDEHGPRKVLASLVSANLT